jgi:4'-phosphopantetheinyl transferase
MSLPHWCLPPERLTLDHAGEVHVWRSLLDLPRVYVDRLADTLAADERARADRFRFDQDRARFIVAHGVLRSILSCYEIDGSPAALEFSYDAYGKPALLDSGLCFSLSHSRALALYAVTRGRAIGVDVEYVRPELAEDLIADRFFAPGEVLALRRLPKVAQPEAFFTCWTRKEAYIKGCGKGLSLPLHDFEVSVAPGETPVRLHARDGAAGGWSLCDICPGSDYVAALAVAGPIGRLNLWQWPVL